ncbi:hypothetical protein NHF46_17630 [Arthrobacter alpinus]|nr:hypothetical protein [Arthrobacter alpinus]
MANEVVGHLGDGRGHAICPSLNNWLTPANDSLICFHPQKQPPGRDLEGFDLGNLHVSPSGQGSLVATAYQSSARQWALRTLPSMCHQIKFLSTIFTPAIHSREILLKISEIFAGSYDMG